MAGLKPGYWKCLASMLALAIIGCSPKKEEGSRVRIQFPETKESEANGKASSLALTGFSWGKVCYVINITAPDIEKKPGTSCDIPIGIFAGSVAPGGELTIDVPRGSGRHLEVFAYLRASTSDACPALKDGFQSLDRSRIARIGQVASFDALDPLVQVLVEVAAPAAGSDLVSQYQLPSTCRPSAPPVNENGGSKVSLGSAKQSGGKFTVMATVSARKNETVLSGGKFKVQMTRRQE